MTQTQLMGILNVTPDSFFDKGAYFDHNAAVNRALQIYAEGADIIDIGGESTRPGATPLSDEEELARVIPVIEALKGQIPITISIDTMKPAVAKAAINAGARLINDVSGFRHSEMRAIAASAEVDVCLMHMQGNPQNMQHNPFYSEGIIDHLMHWFDEHVRLMINSGIKEQNIILDPGIGFGKTIADNVEIIHNLPLLKTLGFRLLFGISRKSFIGRILGKSAGDLLAGTLALNTILLQSKVDIIRVHDVKEHRDAIDLVNHMMKS